MTVHGHVVTRLEDQYVEEFYTEVPGKIARGELKTLEQKYEGLESADKALDDVLRGANDGKAVILL